MSFWGKLQKYGIPIVFGGPLTLTADEKIQLRDTGIYINSGADGKLTIAADGTGTDDITVAGSLTIGAGHQITQTDNAYATATTVDYLRSSCIATSGEHMALRVRAEGEAVGASTAEIRGIYAQAVVNAGLYAGVIQNFMETIAKGASTVTTTRGLRVGVENEVTGGAPTMTNVYGLHVIAKLQTAPATDYMAVMVENEKIGTGVAHDAMLYFKSTTWTGGETIATDVISLAGLTGTVTNAINVTGPTVTSVIYGENTATNLLKVSASGKCGVTVSANGMTADPEGDAEAGYITIAVGATGYQIPIYAA